MPWGIENVPEVLGEDRFHRSLKMYQVLAGTQMVSQEEAGRLLMILEEVLEKI